MLFRCRVEKPQLEKANRDTTRLGTSTAEMFRILVAEIAHTGKVSLNLAPEPEAGLDREAAQPGVERPRPTPRLSARRNITRYQTDRRGRFDASTVAKIKDAIRWAFDLLARTPGRLRLRGSWKACGWR